MSTMKPFQLLEINMISAQDLEPCRRKMKTYAVAWVHSERKLSTRIDTQGHTNPTWNDKFVFRVDDEFLHRDTSAVMIEIYAVHWFRDIHVGTVRAIVGNLFPPTSNRRQRQEVQLGMQFVALQVWRPSGRPQGILNIGVALLDSSMRSMPMYFQMGSSAVGYRHLMGEEDPFQNSIANPVSSTTKSNNYQALLSGLLKPELRRTKSDSSTVLESELKPRASSVTNGGSMLNGSEIGKNNNNNNSSSNNNNNKIKTRGSSMLNYTVEKIPVKRKSSSIVNGTEKNNNNYKIHTRGSSMLNYVFDKNTTNQGTVKNNNIGKPPTGLDNNRAPKRPGGSIILTDSELGPSPSEVAAAVARIQHHNRMEENESSLSGWSLDESLEGLESKLERWRTELPPAYDLNDSSSNVSGVESTASKAKNTRSSGRNRRKSFTCFGNICGCSISLTCGPGASASKKKKNQNR